MHLILFADAVKVIKDNLSSIYSFDIIYLEEAKYYLQFMQVVIVHLKRKSSIQFFLHALDKKKHCCFTIKVLYYLTERDVSIRFFKYCFRLFLDLVGFIKVSVNNLKASQYFI